MNQSTLKSNFVLGGTIIACCLLMILAFRLIVVSWTLIGISGVFVLICIGIICGSRIAYFVAQCLYATVTIGLAFNTFNPMAYHEVILKGGDSTPLVLLFLRLMLISLLSATLYWCLREHSKLRRKGPDKKWRNQRRRSANATVNQIQTQVGFPSLRSQLPGNKFASRMAILVLKATSKWVTFPYSSERFNTRAHSRTKSEARLFPHALH